MPGNLKSLIERLNPLCRKAMEEAAELPTEHGIAFRNDVYGRDG